jgi:hypothetical protein
VLKYTCEVPARVPLRTLSMIMPLVPPAAGSVEIRLAPALIQVTVPSAVVAPTVVFHVGVDPPVVVPVALVTASILPLLSTMRFPIVSEVVAVQIDSGVAESGP